MIYNLDRFRLQTNKSIRMFKRAYISVTINIAESSGKFSKSGRVFLFDKQAVTKHWNIKALHAGLAFVFRCVNRGLGR